MSRHLCIAATFVSGRYHGQEWPPAPARLFQALLAGAKTGLYRRHWSEVEGVLRWIEQRPAPAIIARHAQPLAPYRLSVPNNDADRAAREWAANRPYNPASLRTMKQIHPRQIGGASDDQPDVFYFWKLPPDAQPPTEAASKQLTSFLHTLGRGVDMAYADSFLADDLFLQNLASQPGRSRYVPAPTGCLRPVPAPGYLDDLSDAYHRSCHRRSPLGVDAFTRATQYGQQAYEQVGAVSPPLAKFLLNPLGGSGAAFSIPWAFSMRVAAWMRHAVAEALRPEGFTEEQINEWILGHGGNGHRCHMSFVPIPSIGHAHSDGAVRRLLLVEPPGAQNGMANLLQWQLSSSVLRRLLESNGGPRRTAPACLLTQAPATDTVFQKYLPPLPQRSWRSVTPVVLHGHNTLRRKLLPRKTEELLYQAFEESGYPRPWIAEIQFQPAPLWPGTEGALAMRVPEHLRRWPRYHVAVKFHDPIPGPVLVGIGRHYGIGLFAAS